VLEDFTMLRAIGRYFRALGYLLTGRIDSARKVLDTNPHVIRATYDSIVREKKQRINQYKEAVATIVAQQEKKLDQVKTLTEDIERLERLRTGALAKGKQRIAQLQKQGLTTEQIHQDAEYKTCQAAYRDFTSTVNEKQERVGELEREIQDYAGRIGSHKVQLQSLTREIDKLKAEAADAVADIITAKEEQEVADILTGLAEDRTSEELQQMRDLRREVKAEARISKELAGTEARAVEAEFLEFARDHAAVDEFDALVGLAAEKEAGTPERAKEKGTRLPE
jgi:chromosome segregation ATPase